jgi:hypothetical protein
MKILLAHNSTYFPSLGGGDKSNRLLMEALARRGHQVLVATRVERFGDEGHTALLADLAERGVAGIAEGDGVRYSLGGVEVRALSRSPQLRAFFQSLIERFDPDIIITSTDDPGQLLFDLAVRAPRARVVYLVRATIAVPFGPDSSMVSAAKTAMLGRADLVVGVSHYVAGYVREWSGIDAIHVPISLLEPVKEYQPVYLHGEPVRREGQLHLPGVGRADAAGALRRHSHLGHAARRVGGHATPAEHHTDGPHGQHRRSTQADPRHAGAEHLGRSSFARCTGSHVARRAGVGQRCRRTARG